MASMAIGAGLGIAGGIMAGLNDKPSAAQLALNSQINDFSGFVTSQAKTEGIDAGTTFNNLMGPLQRIVSGGPMQAGWSNAQVSDYNSAITQSAAAAARDMGAVGTGAGGPGQSAATVMAARQKAEDQRSAGIAAGQQASYKQGQENFQSAVKDETALPGVFSTANAGAGEAVNANKAATESQAAVDAAKKASSGLGIASGLLSSAGGAMTADKGGTMLKGLQGFMKGGAPQSANSIDQGSSTSGDIAGAVPNADMFS